MLVVQISTRIQTHRGFLRSPGVTVREYFTSVVFHTCCILYLLQLAQFLSPRACADTQQRIKLKDASPVLTRVQALTFSSSLEINKKRSS